MTAHICAYVAHYDAFRGWCVVLVSLTSGAIICQVSADHLDSIRAVQGAQRMNAAVLN